MTLLPYFSDLTEELRRRSARLREDFAAHRPSAGHNREDLVGDLLEGYLPSRFGIDTGLVLSKDGQFSKEADLLIVDREWNAPLHPTSPNRIWFAESVYCMIEVKTNLTPSTLQDAFSKAKRFKTLPREYDDFPRPPRLAESLFVVWSFEGPSRRTLTSNVREAMRGVPRSEQPDMVVVLGQYLARLGAYHELCEIGLPGSQHRAVEERARPAGGDGSPLVRPLWAVESENALFLWLFWLTQWLKVAGVRSAPILSYVPPDLPLGMSFQGDP